MTGNPFHLHRIEKLLWLDMTDVERYALVIVASAFSYKELEKIGQGQIDPTDTIAGAFVLAQAYFDEVGA